MKGKWRAIGKRYAISLIGINETLLGGQSFAWTAESENQWVGIIRKAVVQLRWIDGQLEWRSSGIKPMSEADLLDYLWLDESYDLAVDQLPWRSDQPLHRAVKHFPGLRILRQPIDETLLVFLLSSAKSIPQIKKLREKIHLLFGQSLDRNLYAFPGWDRIKKISESKARELGVGYRAKYLVGTASFLAKNPNFLNEIKKLSHQSAKLKLMELPGVGPKVADCILLFGGEKSEAFPIDTWILQSMEKQYGMKGWKISQMEEFSRIHFGLYAGLAQQFLFSYQRNFGKKMNSKSTKN
jgi:N-glycosylase/DNA lyase